METKRIALDQPTSQQQAYLISISQPDKPSISIHDFVTIGRDSSCQIVINDSFVSSRHARIERRGASLVLRDLHSKNGTFLNGSRVNEISLSAGDRLRFGESVFVFSDVETDAPKMTSNNSAWSDQLARLPVFAMTEFPILITGPSGTGKEILAQSLHRQSVRANGPFIGINCSALSESLIESELFGHVKGAFTGAANDRKGAFEAARGGTLFLDEIGDLPLSLQPKILRALESREIRPVGSDKSIQTDVRIVAATHKNLIASVRAGHFREDLYYRLNVCNLRPPSLAERNEDFEELLYQFAKQFRVRFSFNAIQKLKAHSWPGNIRELKNLVARASAYYPSKHIQPEDLAAIMEPQNPHPPEVHFVSDHVSWGLPGRNASIIKEIEREMIIRRLVANKGNQRRTAQDLGLPKSTLHDRIKTYSIDLEAIGGLEAEAVKV